MNSVWRFSHVVAQTHLVTSNVVEVASDGCEPVVEGAALVLKGVVLTGGRLVQSRSREEASRLLVLIKLPSNAIGLG
jgi:hypothetical protein